MPLRRIPPAIREVIQVRRQAVTQRGQRQVPDARRNEFQR
jgi:hypothetical protein